MRLDGKRIIVTGGGRGIGASAVRAFAREGAAVAALDMRDDLGAQVAAEASETGPGRASYYRCDVSQRAEVRDVFARAVKDLGGLDALVHVAGVHREAPPELITDEDWDLIMNVNLRGAFVTNQEAFPYLRDNGGGRIINFGSSAGQAAYFFAAHYSASKGGVLAWSRSVAHAWGRYGILVNAVNPSIDTPMGREAGARMEAAAGKPLPDTAALSALGRPGDPDRDIAGVLVFMLTDEAGYITAQIISVDGGLVPLR